MYSVQLNYLMAIDCSYFIIQSSPEARPKYRERVTERERERERGREREREGERVLVRKDVDPDWASFLNSARTGNHVQLSSDALCSTGPG